MTDPSLEQDLLRHVPNLLSRARALLRLKGGPSDRLGPGELQPAARAVEALHRGLVGERQLARASTYDAAAHLGAYLLWWWPQSYAKVRAALCLAPPAAPAPRVRLLDLGGGPGPGAIALRDRFAGSGSAVEATVADASRAALTEAQALGGPSLRTEVVDLEGQVPAAGPFDLVSVAHVLSELPGGAAGHAAVVRRFVPLLAPGGRLLLLEPALRETGRGLLEVRDLLLAGAGDGTTLRALGPCLTQKPCPALQDKRDWCTAELPWTPPPHLVALGRELGLHPEAPLHFSALVLGAAAPVPAPDLFRVVGVPQPEKGKKRLFVCNDQGRQPVVLLDRDQGAPTEAFGGLVRGDRVRLSGLSQKGDGLRLGAGSRVEPEP